MVDTDILSRKLAQLDENITILKSLQNCSIEEFLSNPERYGAVERFLQLSIEILDDIGAHVISDSVLGQVNYYSDIPKILNDKSIISSHLCETWISMIGFRNILVHGYTKLDRSIVYSVLQNKITEIEEIAKSFAKLI
jgi:uncharacterized protein YutE (UPF0331/DUF86 family)